MTAHPFASTEAAQMLAHGLRSASQERGVSLREIGRRLGYKQPVVLSHMAAGRVPIPLDRAPAIASEVGLAQAQFLRAVLQQRHPEVKWGLITGTADEFATELERTAGKPLSTLSAAQQRVLRDVVRDSDAELRWLTIPEISAVQLLRELFPRLRTDGMNASDREFLRTLAELLNETNEKGE
jgi:hypothetical protein